MKTLIALDTSTINALADRINEAEGRPEFQRIQCVLILRDMDTPEDYAALSFRTDHLYLIRALEFIDDQQLGLGEVGQSLLQSAFCLGPQQLTHRRRGAHEQAARTPLDYLPPQADGQMELG